MVFVHLFDGLRLYELKEYESTLRQLTNFECQQRGKVTFTETHHFFLSFRYPTINLEPTQFSKPLIHEGGSSILLLSPESFQVQS